MVADQGAIETNGGRKVEERESKKKDRKKKEFGEGWPGRAAEWPTRCGCQAEN